MLRFIVLGQIPGTAIQLTFTQVLLFAIGFYGGLLSFHQFKHRLSLTPLKKSAQ